jgi:hypothetical protein
MPASSISHNTTLRCFANMQSVPIAAILRYTDDYHCHMRRDPIVRELCDTGGTSVLYSQYVVFCDGAVYPHMRSSTARRLSPRAAPLTVTYPGGGVA